MKTDMTEEEIHALRGECDRFLRAYNEESTMRVSREAYNHVITVLSNIMVKKYSEACPRCGRLHPLIRIIWMNGELKKFFQVVSLDLRTKELRLVNKTWDEMREEMQSAGLPGSLPEQVQSAFLAAFVIMPRETSLEELVTLNIRPFHLVKGILGVLDGIENVKMMRLATQEPACA